MYKLIKSQNGSVAVIALAMLVFVLAALVGWMVIDRATTDDTSQSVATSQSEQKQENPTSQQPESELSSLERAQRNTSAKNDAYKIATAVAEFSLNNTGYMPDDYVDGSLTTPGGYPQAVKLEYYKDITVTDDQTVTPNNSTVVVMTKATCNSDETAPVTATSSRQYVVLYALLTASGGTETLCINA